MPIVLNRNYLVLLVIIFSACAPKPYRAANKAYKKQARQMAKIIRRQPSDSIVADSIKWPAAWVGTVNFGMRKPNFVILHHTAQNSCQQTLETFTKEISQVSAHYVICRDGTLHHMLNDYLRAWHAGASKWGSMTDINSSSIGIEIDNNGEEVFTEAQINVLLGLLATIKQKYNIPAANFIGHADIAPSRKKDPSVLFPWKRLADSGFGVWYNDTTNISVPPGFQPVQALKIIGYDIANIDFAIQAFRRHFLQREQAGELNEQEIKVLYAVMLRYL